MTEDLEPQIVDAESRESGHQIFAGEERRGLGYEKPEQDNDEQGQQPGVPLLQTAVDDRLEDQRAQGPERDDGEEREHHEQAQSPVRTHESGYGAQQPDDSRESMR